MARQPPTNAPQTLKRAKLLHRKKQPGQLSKEEQRRIDRVVELERRAEENKQREERRKQAQTKRLEKEQRERDARRRNGVSMATQLAGFNHTQLKLKNGMERFLKLGAKKEASGVQSVVEETMDSSGLVPLPATTAPLNDIDETLFGNASMESLDALVMEALPPVVQPQAIEKPTDPWDDEDIDDETFLDVVGAPVPSDKQKASPPRSITHTPKTTINDKQTSGRVKTLSKVSFAGVATIPIEQPSGTQISDAWDCFLDSNTQILKELDNSPCVTRQRPQGNSGTKMLGAASPVADPITISADVSDHRSATPALNASDTQATTAVNLSEFGLCTQDVHDFIEDDLELSFGT